MIVELYMCLNALVATIYLAVRISKHYTACTDPIFNPSIPGVFHAIIDITTLIPPVSRERNRLPTRPEEDERHQEHDNLGSSIQSRAQHIIEAQEPVRLVSPQVELRPDSDDEEREDSRIDACD